MGKREVNTIQDQGLLYKHTEITSHGKEHIKEHNYGITVGLQ